QGFGARSGTAIENAKVFLRRAQEGGDELRRFVLNDDLSGPENFGVSYVARLNPASRREKATGSQGDSFFQQLGLCCRTAEANHRGWDGLVVLAELVGDVQSVFAGPTLNNPCRMCEISGQCFGRV